MRLLLWAIVSLIFFAYHFYLDTTIPFTWPDEVLFFNPSFEWYQSGFLRTTVLSGLIPGMEKVTVWMPPLYLLSLGTSYYFWEPTLTNARLLSSGIGIITAVILFYFLKKESRSIRNKEWYAILGIIFILLDILYIKVTHTARMESLTSCLGILAILSIHKKNLFLSGLFLGLSFLSHPFGGFYGIPVLYIIITERFYRKITVIIPFLIGGLIPILSWLVYLVPNFDIFLIQFGAQLARKKELFQTFTHIDKVKILLSGYFLPSIKGILLGCLIIYAWLQSRKPENRKLYNLLFVWLIAMSIGFYSSSESWYVVHLTYPIAGLFYLSLLSASNSRFRTGFFILLMGYQVLSFAWFFWAFRFQEDAFSKTDLYMKQVEEISKNHKSIYLQLIPDPYFHLKEKYPNTRLYEFIPGELPIPSSYYRDTLESIDLFLFHDDQLINESIRTLINNDNLFQKKIVEIPYTSKVPGKGPWKIIAYSKK